MSFSPIPLTDGALTLPDVLARTADANSNYPFALLVNGDEVRTVTWGKYVEDIRSAAARLRSIVEVAPSKDGPPAVAIMAASNYLFAVNTMAIVSNGWIVRNVTFVVAGMS